MHLKRLNSPKIWKIKRKEKICIVKPMPGPHPLKRCIPLGIIIRDRFGYAETMKETKRILNSGEILINNKPTKNPKLPVGIMDIIEIKKLGEAYRVYVNEEGHIEFKKIKKEDAHLKLLKIIKKTSLKKGIIQLNFHEGSNLLLKEKKTDYKIGDSVIFNLKTRKITKHLKLEKGAKAYLVSGRHIGKTGVIDEIIKKQNHKDLITMTSNKSKIHTLKEYVFVIEGDTI